MKTQEAPVVRTEMLIRRPISDVFGSFVDPAITSKFWFTSGDGRLEEGRRVLWEWDKYRITAHVNVIVIEENRRIVIEWHAPGAAPTMVEWVFTPRPDITTLVTVTNSGFRGDDDEIVRQALDSTGGFALVLAGAKAFLEHGIRLNLIADRYPDW